ncbi:MAG: hypothetical protein EBU59_03385 [Planctomycetia bacterium]|jgi:hypothetical protein|nr:hypothetical protein [Planctomycetia bacterium]
MKRRLFLGFLASSAFLTTPACKRYGELSDLGYDYAKALHALSRRKQKEKTEAFARLLDNSLNKGELPPREGVWLKTILDDARAERWPEAIRASRALMESQIKPL